MFLSLFGSSNIDRALSALPVYAQRALSVRSARSLCPLSALYVFAQRAPSGRLATSQWQRTPTGRCVRNTLSQPKCTAPYVSDDPFHWPRIYRHLSCSKITIQAAYIVAKGQLLWVQLTAGR
jgi:hypothetical protein